MDWTSKEQVREYNHRKRRERRKRLHDQSLCINCGKGLSSHSKWYCEQCLEKHRVRIRRYRVEDPKKFQGYRKRSYAKLRLQALQRIAGENKLPLRCPCGCDDFSLLEINHKNGGGSKELKSIGTHTYLRMIARGERPVDDLDIKCRVCNAANYCFRKAKRQWKIIYQG